MCVLGEKLSRRREREREVCERAGRETEQTQIERERCVRVLGEKLSRRREREREVCARAGRETEQTQREGERGVCACWERN